MSFRIIIYFIQTGAKEQSLKQKHSIFVCRTSGAFYSFLTKIACSEVPSGFVPGFATVSQI